MKERVQVACGQMQPEFGETTANLERIGRMVEGAGADIMIFPELVTSGYEFRDRRELRKLAIDLGGGEEISRLKSLAGDTGTHIVLGLPERSGRMLFNSAVLIEPSGRVTVYRKLHLFDREKKLFDPGESEPPVVETPVGRLGLMVCFDWIFPEVARLLALKGAQVILHPSNLVLQYCQRAMFARSVENGVFTVTCNRVGSESRTGRTLTFTGASQILSPRGQILAQAGNAGEEIISAEINPTDADDKMITATNHILKDRRTEFYPKLI